LYVVVIDPPGEEVAGTGDRERRGAVCREPAATTRVACAAPSASGAPPPRVHTLGPSRRQIRRESAMICHASGVLCLFSRAVDMKMTFFVLLARRCESSHEALLSRRLYSEEMPRDVVAPEARQLRASAALPLSSDVFSRFCPARRRVAYDIFPRPRVTGTLRPPSDDNEPRYPARRTLSRFRRSMAI